MFPYTYSAQHRPFEHEGFNPDFHYSDIQRATWALGRLARAQYESIFDQLMAYWRDIDHAITWEELFKTPLGIEYRALRDSHEAWSRLMGFPGYWTNWQIKD